MEDQFTADLQQRYPTVSFSTIVDVFLSLDGDMKATETHIKHVAKYASLHQAEDDDILEPSRDTHNRRATNLTDFVTVGRAPRNSRRLAKHRANRGSTKQLGGRVNYHEDAMGSSYDMRTPLPWAGHSRGDRAPSYLERSTDTTVETERQTRNRHDTAGTKTRNNKTQTQTERSQETDKADRGIDSTHDSIVIMEVGKASPVSEVIPHLNPPVTKATVFAGGCLSHCESQCHDSRTAYEYGFVPEKQTDPTNGGSAEHQIDFYNRVNGTNCSENECNSVKACSVSTAGRSPPSPPCTDQSPEVDAIEVLTALYSDHYSLEFLIDFAKEHDGDVTSCVHALESLLQETLPKKELNNLADAEMTKKERKGRRKSEVLRAWNSNLRTSCLENQWGVEEGCRSGNLYSNAITASIAPPSSSTKPLLFTEKLQLEVLVHRYKFLEQDSVEQYFEMMGRDLDKADMLIKDCLPPKQREQCEKSQLIDALAAAKRKTADPRSVSPQDPHANPYSIASKLQNESPINRREKWPQLNTQAGSSNRLRRASEVLDMQQVVSDDDDEDAREYTGVGNWPQDFTIPFEHPLTSNVMPTSPTNTAGQQAREPVYLDLMRNSQTATRAAQLHQETVQCGVNPRRGHEIETSAHSIFLARNPGTFSITLKSPERLWRSIDLHGLFRDEAPFFIDSHIKRMFDVFLSSQNKSRCNISSIVLHVITGQGKHSRPRYTSHLRQVVVRYAAERRYNWRNGAPGVVLLRVYCSSKD
eukprot:GHVN01107043.1.p1 GENE.GHVN01107043.1~~GHVN01107043.1.p1  ORF type:complete len:756 (+),score=74.61 GHVN01107043.1:785-3052(+)